MTYEKPEVLAQNAPEGSFAAGCEVKGGDSPCSIMCEIRN